MSVNILSLSSKVPSKSYPQKTLALMMEKFLCLKGTQKQFLHQIYDNSQIAKRHTVVDLELFFERIFSKNSIGTKERNVIYQENAPKLALDAASDAIEKWEGDKSLITHIISVSCTGTITPGIEFIVSQKLGLNKNISRLGINFMGCFGAFKGLEVASSIVKSNPKNTVLLICTELCSLHLQKEKKLDAIIANAIFSDGSAAAIIGNRTAQKTAPLFEIVDHSSFALEHSLELMSWNASDHGMEITLSKNVPQAIEDNLCKVIFPLIKKWEIDRTKLRYAIHPGGKAILDGIEKALQIEKNKIQASWQVLNEYGNMSSASFLFVLQKLLEENTNTSTPYLGIGFGPGLSVETLFFKKV